MEQLLTLCEQYSVRPRLIGGLAVRGYAQRKRFTHDIDLAIQLHDKPMFVSILKQMNFEYQDLSRFEGIKATKQIGSTAVEIHISVEKLWDMTSNQTYTLSSASEDVSIDDAGKIVAPAVSAEDLLILKLMPLRDRDKSDVIALFLDLPQIDANTFWKNCERTSNTQHISAQLAKLENAIKNGSFRAAWQDFYGTPLSMRQVALVLEKVRTLLKAKP